MEIKTRIFCQSPVAPNLDDILAGLQQQGFEAIIEHSDAAVDEARAWQHCVLATPPAMKRISLSCMQKSAPAGDAFSQELASWLQRLRATPASAERRVVLGQLRHTAFIITSEFVIEDPEDDIFDFNSAILIYLHDNFRGMIQADGEGFYDNEDELLVELE